MKHIIKIIAALFVSSFSYGMQFPLLRYDVPTHQRGERFGSSFDIIAARSSEMMDVLERDMQRTLAYQANVQIRFSELARWHTDFLPMFNDHLQQESYDVSNS